MLLTRDILPHSHRDAEVLAPSADRPDVNCIVADSPDRLDAWNNDGGAKALPVMTPRRVLVVEDDSLIGALLAETLEDVGYDVCAIAATEDDAVAAAVRYEPDLMIVDAWLIDGNGMSAVERILRTGFVPHVFVSGDISRITVNRPDAVMLQKPFNEAALTQAIQRAFSAEAVS